MPRKKRHSRTWLLDQSMRYFWSMGFQHSSMDQLVDATGASRHGIYSEFGGKRDLFLACLDHYRDQVVSPAFETVEDPNAGTKNIRAYFTTQINAHAVPGPGCLMANTSTEVGPHDPVVEAKVIAHHQRLQAGFTLALRNESQHQNCRLTKTEIRNMAELLVGFAQGLWLLSRSAPKKRPLLNLVTTQMTLVEARLSSS